MPLYRRPGKNFAVRSAIGASCAALLLLLWGLTLERINYEQREAEEAAVTTNVNLALAFEQHIVLSLKAVDQTLISIAQQYRQLGDRLDMEAVARSKAIDTTLLKYVDIVDAQGVGKRPPRINASDRDFFQFHREDPDDGLRIGKPTIDRVTQQPTIHMTRRLNAADGSFAGVVFGSVDPAYFSSFYQHINLDRNGMVQLVGLDGIVRARRWGDTPSYGQDMNGSTLFESLRRGRSANFVSSGRTDGIVRLISYRRLKDYPLVICVGSSRAAVLAESNARAHNYIAVAVLGSLLIVAAGAALFIAWSRETKTRERLTHQAQYDMLTELPNRGLLYDRLDQMLKQTQRRQSKVAVLFADLDRFKVVNDTLGHVQGDRLLQGVAKRLVQCVRGGDTVARLGGDEFAVLLGDLGKPEDAATVAGKILEALGHHFELEEGQKVFVSSSIGIAVYPLDGKDGTTLVKNADAAMFRAKEMGRSNYQFYTAAMNEHALDKLVLETELRRAIERNEFELFYQPKAQLASRHVSGFEALLRWRRSDGTLVPPAEFIPLLEDTGLIVPVGEWVIRAACAQLKKWRDEGYEVLPVAVNIAARQFIHNDLPAVLEKAIGEAGIEPRLLEIELTESDALRDPPRATSVLNALRRAGIRISLDDFGTGYSSLAYLKRLPIDALKLDRSFVVGLPHNSDDVAITNAVIAMAHSLGLQVIAEGVETEGQRSFLASRGCDAMQGYLLSKPVPAADCARFLVTRQAKVHT
jgi:diguanylate cyclase (GGDEF)-like protein